MNDEPRGSVHDRHRAATRKHLLDTALTMLRDTPGEDFSHEELARRAGVSARTVYRYFPNRAELIRALWERLREETGTRWPATEEQILPALRAQFAQFESHSALVRASIVASAKAHYATYGSAEGRAAFRTSLAELIDALPEERGDQLIAICVSIYSAPFWQMLRDRGQLPPDQAVEAAAWALSAILADARQNIPAPGIGNQQRRPHAERRE